MIRLKLFVLSPADLIRVCVHNQLVLAMPIITSAASPNNNNYYWLLYITGMWYFTNDIRVNHLRSPIRLVPIDVSLSICNAAIMQHYVWPVVVVLLLIWQISSLAMEQQSPEIKITNPSTLISFKPTWYVSGAYNITWRSVNTEPNVSIYLVDNTFDRIGANIRLLSI